MPAVPYCRHFTNYAYTWFIYHRRVGCKSILDKHEQLINTRLLHSDCASFFITKKGSLWSETQDNKTTRKRWYMFTSDSGHLHRIRTAIQPAENARTLWDERVPTLAIFARPRTHRTGPDSYAAFPKTKPDPTDCWTKHKHSNNRQGCKMLI